MELRFAKLYNPKGGLFKHEKTAHAEVTLYFCSLPDCPLGKQNQCTRAPFLSYDFCPYGKVTAEEGPTPRAKSLDTWIAKQRERIGTAPWPHDPPMRMAFIGDYVYLPYAHMTLFVGPWLRQASIFVKGIAFIPKTAWHIDLVLDLLDFRPKALTGDVITHYAQKSIPLFLTHLREVDPAMWQEVIAVRPQLDVPPQHVGRKALLRTLRPGIILPPVHNTYPVRWTWDGKVLTTESMAVYQVTWGGFKLDQIQVTAVPKADAVVEVKDESWVTSDTIFVN